MKHVLIAILGTLICGNSFANTFDHPTIHYWCAEIWESSRSEGISVSQGENGFNKSEVLNYGEAVGLGTNNFEAASLSFSSKPSASFEGGSPVYLSLIHI